MLVSRAFTSYTLVPDARDHVRYNEWHQLDHRPENLALPGVVAGERWVRTPACQRLGSALEQFAGFEYFTTYWFADAATIVRWRDLGEQTFQAGRRDDVNYIRRPWVGFHRPINAHVSSRATISPEALLHRPNRGIYLIVSALDDPRSAAAHEWNLHFEQDYVVAQLARPGVAGCWTLTAESAFSGPAAAPGASAASEARPSPLIRTAIFFLDEPPVDVARDWEPPPAPTGARTLVCGPLEAIEPWRWDWFEER